MRKTLPQTAKLLRITTEKPVLIRINKLVSVQKIKIEIAVTSTGTYERDELLIKYDKQQIKQTNEYKVILKMHKPKLLLLFQPPRHQPP